MRGSMFQVEGIISTEILRQKQTCCVPGKEVVFWEVLPSTVGTWEIWKCGCMA